MSTEQFEEIQFQSESRDRLEMANRIIQEYRGQGFILTLRQLYYQFVARDLIPNTEKSYKNLGNLLSRGRLAGVIDWGAIEDRTRNVEANPHWQNAASYVMPDGFAVDKWGTQRYRPEVWIEKEALIGVIEDVCSELDVPFFACRGYNSQSEQWKAGKRFEAARHDGQWPVVIHLGDHDPSGIDMTRDNKDRLDLFSWDSIDVRRVALNMDQVEEYGPPPNPTKPKDSRTDKYVARFGPSCWELDALEPVVIRDLIESEILSLRDDDAWDERVAYEDTVKTEFLTIREELEERGL